jgi:predicted O-methyltransferase YrrM
MKRAALVITAWAVLAACTTTAHAQRPRRPDGPPGQGAEPGPPGRFNPLLRLFDTDGDGTLAADEIDGAAAKLRALDASKDGQLTADELRPALPFGPRGPMPPGPGGPQRGPGSRGPGGRAPGGRGPRPARASEADFDNPLLAKDDQEKKILATLDAMRRGPRFANVSPTDGRLLRLLAEAVGAKRVVEIGTSTGESGVWFAMALRKTGGHLFTHEIDAERAEVAEENFKKAGVDDLVTIVLGDAHETVKRYQEPIDILFLDADKQGYIDYLDKLLPLVRPGGLIIAHNMSPRMADPDYLNAITKSPDLETAFLLMDGAGVGVTLKKR